MLQLRSMETKPLLIFAAAFVLVAGCRASTEAGVTTTTAAQVGPVSNSKAKDAIVQEHCTHVFHCNEFGGTHRFEDYDSCARSVRSETLTTPGCGEIDAAKLSSCLEAIRTSNCGAPRSARFSACSNEMLCR